MGCPLNRDLTVLKKMFVRSCCLLINENGFTCYRGGKKLLLLRTFLCDITVPGNRACAEETGLLLREKQKKSASDNNNQWQN